MSIFEPLPVTVITLVAVVPGLYLDRRRLAALDLAQVLDPRVLVETPVGDWLAVQKEAYEPPKHISYRPSWRVSGEEGWERRDLSLFSSGAGGGLK